MIWKVEKFLSFIECQNIIKQGLKSNLRQSEIVSGIDTTVRNSKQIRIKEPVSDLNKRLISELNKVKVDGYDVSNFSEDWQFACYEVGGFYNWHTDNGDTSLSKRYYSISILLNSDFEGGELEIDWQNEKKVWNLLVGDVILFPSSAYHRVRKVDSGVRYSLVNWIGLHNNGQKKSLL